MSHPNGYVDPEFLRVIGELFGYIKQRSYTLMQLQAGCQVLDLGCGPGTDTIPLASLVGKQGQVVGVDYDADMVTKAQQSALEAGLAEYVKHQQADAGMLPFADNFFDASRSERLFQHLFNPDQALAEMVRVTKSGGWVVVADTDWGSLSVDSNEADIERRLAQFMAGSFLHNGYSGRKLHRLFKQQGLADIALEVFPIATRSYTLAREGTRADEVEQAALDAGVVTADELYRWHQDLEAADRNGCYFSSVNVMLFAGRKP